MSDGPSTLANRAVFLSYASQDVVSARRICETLRSGGIEVWFDQAGLEHGDEWDAKIRRQIKECVFFVPLISANTQARIEGYFRIEWDLAAERAQGIAHGVAFILPITIDATHEADALVPDRFRKVQWTHLPDGTLSPEVLTRLLRLWAQRTGAVPQNPPRAVAVSPNPPKPASAQPGPSRIQPAAVPGAPFLPPVRRVAPTPFTPAAPIGGGLGTPKGAGRFGSLEFGGPKSDAPKPEVVKDEAYYLAEAHERFHTGRYDLALRAYSKVLEYNATNQDAWTAQVRMLVELGELREARLWADKALERFAIYPDLLAAKAAVLGRMAELDSALAFSDAAIEERGNTPYVWLARGDVLLSRGEAKASYCFEQALTLSRGDWVQVWQASRIYSFHHGSAMALRHAQQAIELAPERAVVWLQTGLCQIALAQGHRAQESLVQARAIDPECPGLERALEEVAKMTAGNPLTRFAKKFFP